MMSNAQANDGTDTHQWNRSPLGQRPGQEMAPSLSTADIVFPAISPVSQCVL